MNKKESILIIDDDKDISETLVHMFEKKGYETETAGTGQEALEKAKGKFFNVALLDIRLPDMEGIELLSSLKKMQPDMEVIVITAYASLENAVGALNGGASAYITKPFNKNEMLTTVRNAVEKQRLVMENRRLFNMALRELDNRRQAEKKLLEERDKAKRALKKLKDVQSQLIQSEKLAALGKLSAGVAHEIDNPLNIILGYTDMLLMEKKFDPDEVKETLTIIKEQVDQASTITDRLLHFAKKSKSKMETVNVNELIRNVVALLEHQLILDNIKIERQLSSKLPSISADPSQLQQVFLDLITNASHAMPKGGTLTITTEVKTPNVEIRFSDTGIGIPKENLARLFEPFFTTRHEGSGLGLSVVHGIIELHSGSIKVDSEVGKGSTFTTTLPIEGKL